MDYKYLEGDGDFRSEEVIKLRDEADFIITNPPFSLFREFLKWILNANKKFIIIGNLNAVSYKEVFSLIQGNYIWIGSTGRVTYFNTPKTSEEKLQNSRLMPTSSIWYTNVEHGIRHRPMQLMSEKDNLKFNTALKNILKKKYETDYYPKYENFDAIEVPITNAIPSDYKGVMGVPISFMDKYCPEQFEIIGSSRSREIAKEDFKIKAGNKSVELYRRIIIKHKKNKK